jgi:ASC-1-like (ASCH) protein
MDYKLKYIKYKTKYLEQDGGRRKSKKKFNNTVSINNSNSVINNSDSAINNNNSIKPNYVESILEPWFSLILLGLKTVEGRRNKGKFKEMKVGDIIQWNNFNFKPRSVLTKVTGKTEYSTFKEYLEKEGLDKCLPGMEKLGSEKLGIEHGLSIYYKYFTKEDEKEFGVVAIRMTVI